MSDEKYDYNRFGSKGKRVGQAVYDILSKDQPYQSAGDTFDALAPRFVQELEDTIKNNEKKYDSPFYVIVFTNKEMWAPNVMRNWFIARQTAPRAMDMIHQYPHHVKTLYKVDSKEGSHKVQWTIPGFEDCKSILKNPQAHDPQLVTWIISAFEGSLDSSQLLVS